MDGPHFVDSKLDSFLLGLGDPSNVFICFDPLKIQRQERHPKCLYLAMHMLLIVICCLHHGGELFIPDCISLSSSAHGLLQLCTLNMMIFLCHCSICARISSIFSCQILNSGNFRYQYILFKKCMCETKKKITQFCFSIYFNDCSFLMPQKLRKQRNHLRNKSIFSVRSEKK